MDNNAINFGSNAKFELDEKMQFIFKYGLKNYNLAKNSSNQILNYFLDKLTNAKKIEFPILLELLNKYGVHNVDTILLALSNQKFSSIEEAITYFDMELLSKFQNHELIEVEKFAKIKELYPHLFKEEIDPIIKRIINKILSSENTLTIQESIALKKSEIDLSMFSKKIYAPQYNVFLEAIGESNFKELTSNIHILNLESIIAKFSSQNEANSVFDFLWDNQDYFYNTEKFFVKNFVLKNMNIRGNADLIIQSEFYQGKPIVISDYITDEQIKELVPEKLLKIISITNWKELYNYYSIEMITAIINLANYYEELIKDTKHRDKRPIYDDFSNNITILDLLKKGTIPFNNFDFNNLQLLTTDINQIERIIKEKLSDKITGDINPSTVKYNYQTLIKWKEIFKGESFNAAFAEMFPLAMADRVLEKKAQFENFNYGQKFGWSQSSKSLIGASIIFGLWNEESNLEEVNQNIINCFEKLALSETRNNAFNNIFSNVSFDLNENLLKSLQTDYQLLTDLKYEEVLEFCDVLYYQSCPNIRKHQFNSVQEILTYNKETYLGINPNCGYAAVFMKKNNVYWKDYQELEKLYEFGMERSGSTIPFINKQVDNFSYQTIKLWDSYLMYFDIENINQNIDILSDKKELLTNNNVRLIEIKDKNNKVINLIKVVRKDNNLILISLMNNKIDQNILNSIEKEYQNIITESNINVLVSEDNITVPNEINPNKLYQDEPEIFITGPGEAADLPYPKRIKAYDIGTLAFESAMSSLSYQNMFNDKVLIKHVLGRDWYLNWVDEPDHAKLEIIARFNKNDSEKSLGRQEMKENLSKIINETPKVIKSSLLNTSYFLFVSMAKNGEIFVQDDTLVSVDTSMGMMASAEKSNFYPNRINDFSGYGLNVNNFPDCNNDNTINRVEFLSIKNLNEEQKQNLEIQKKFYSKIFDTLSKMREIDKHINHYDYWRGYSYHKTPEEYIEDQYPGNLDYIEKEYANLATKEPLKKLKNLKVYSIKYLKYQLYKESLINNYKPNHRI